MSKKRGYLLVTSSLAMLLCGGAYFLDSGEKPKPIGQPVAGSIVISGMDSAETISIRSQKTAVLLESLFPKLYDEPASAMRPTDGAKFHFRFRYRDGRTRDVQVTARDETGRWLYGGGKFEVDGDLELTLQLLPFIRTMANEDVPAEERVDLLRDGADYIDPLKEWMISGNGTHEMYAAMWFGTGMTKKHPRFPEIRSFAMTRVQALLAQHCELVSQRDCTDQERLRGFGVYYELCHRLPWMLDEKSAKHATDILTLNGVPSWNVYLLEAVESYYGLPPFVNRLPPRCGNMSDQERQRLQQESDQRVRDGIRRYLHWSKQYENAPRDERLHAIVDAWDETMQDGTRWERPWTDEWSSPYQTCQRLLRFGEEVRPFLEAKRESADDTLHRGRFAFLAGAVGAEIDEDIIGSLLGYPGEGQFIACDLIQRTGTTNFNQQLQTLASVPASSVARKAAETLEVVEARANAAAP